MNFKATPHNAQLTPLLRICLHLFRHTSQLSSVEKSLLPPQFVLSDEKSGGATAQQSLCGIALRKPPQICGSSVQIKLSRGPIRAHFEKISLKTFIKGILKGRDT